jgi:hypothetical protein
MSANAISIQQAGFDVKSEGGGVSAPTKAGELNGRSVVAIDVNDSEAWNKFLDREIASNLAEAPYKELYAIVGLILWVAGPVFLVLMPMIVSPITAIVSPVLYCIAQSIGAGGTMGLGVAFGLKIHYKIALNERDAFELESCKTALANREFIDFVKTTLKSTKLSYDQLRGACSLFQISELNKQISAAEAVKRCGNCRFPI